jgi:hypothetical protein
MKTLMPLPDFKAHEPSGGPKPLKTPIPLTHFNVLKPSWPKTNENANAINQLQCFEAVVKLKMPMNTPMPLLNFNVLGPSWNHKPMKTPMPLCIFNALRPAALGPKTNEQINAITQFQGSDNKSQ